MSQNLEGWRVPEFCQRMFTMADGFWLFGNNTWDGFKFWGRDDYQAAVRFGGPIFRQSVDGGLFPIFGDIPHLVSVSLASGAVVSSDWEVYRCPEQGWGRDIASSIPEYIKTLIHVREAFGYQDESPSDWWHPYAMYGDRHDLDHGSGASGRAP